MADPNTTPMTSGDIEAPPANTNFQPAAPLKDAGVAFDAEGGTLQSGGKTEDTGLKGSASKLGQQAVDKARTYAEEGKTKATDALGQLSQLLNDAAGQVDQKLGAQYGGYARTAANSVQSFANTVRDKDVDALFDEARGYVRKSPAVAIGVAAALGFAIARLVQSGLDSNADRNDGDSGRKDGSGNSNQRA